MNPEIKKAAIAVFEQYPTAKELFITPDEQAFLKEDRARMHNKDFVTVKRSDVIEVPKEGSAVKKTAAELIEFIPTVETLEELASLETGEKRATVLAAIATRKEELTPKQD
ncbi:hypothetical protein ACFX5D_13405 [Flavobacterium sp. LB3P45]|uniref:Uncharacterized protein n=1 Tax=Flavobacterium fructosi TaxID=3230416 RepID=A0ABW6HQN8_9FLAO